MKKTVELVNVTKSCSIVPKAYIIPVRELQKASAMHSSRFQLWKNTLSHHVLRENERNWIGCFSLTAPCYQCGKKAAIESLCSECYSLKHPLVKVGSPLTILVCRRCGAVKVPGGWRKITPPTSDPEEIIDREIAILLEQEVKVLTKDIELSYTEEKKLDRVIHILLAATGKSHPSLPVHDETYPLEIRFNHGTCDSCALMSGGYHEAILQIRADDRPLTETEETDIMDLVTDLTEAKYGRDTKAFVTETKRDRFGLNFKVGSEHLCRQIADKLESRYLAQRKENYKLIGQDRGGKKKYRITILIRLQKFTNGDFVKVEGIPCQIVSMGRGGLGCYDLSKGISFTINQKSSKWRTLEFLAPESEKRQLMVVSNAYGQPVQLMDSETFDVYELDHEAIHIELAVGETIQAFKLEDRVLLLPRE